MGKITFCITNLHRIFILGSILLSLCTIGMVVLYNHRQNHIVTHYEHILEKKNKEYLKEIQAKFNNIEKKAVELSKSPIIAEAFDAAKTTTSKKQGAPALQSAKTTISEFITPTTGSPLFKNVLLVSPKGEIIFSLNKTNYVGNDLSTPPLSNSGIGLSFLRSFMGLSPDISQFYFDTVIQEFAFYISVPIFKKDTIAGILIMQINQNHIYELTEDYLGLGKTGEPILGNRLGEDTQIIGPTRLQPDIAFKHISPYKINAESPLQLAVNGASNTGLGYDYRENAVIASWDYIRISDWGLITKIDYEEVMAINNQLKDLSFYMAIISLILLILSGCSIPSIRSALGNPITNLHARISPRILYGASALILCTLFSLSGMYIYHKKNSAKSQALIHAQQRASVSGAEAITKIESILEKISLLAQSTASSIELGSLTQADSHITIERKLNANPQLFAFCIVYNQPNNPLNQHALYGARNKNSIETVDLATLLATKNMNPDFSSVPWFKEALAQKKGTWMQPSRELMSNEFVITYAIPFFDAQDKERKNPLGVVAAMYLIAHIKPMLRDLIIGETGYSFIVNEEGKFIYHPKENYNSNATLYTAARQEANEKLATINKEITSGTSGMASYKDSKTNELMWIIFKPFSAITWSLGISFIHDEITPPTEQSHRQSMWLVICFIAALFFISIGLSLLLTQHPLTVISITSPIIFIAGILAIWSLVEPEIKINDSIVINNEIGLDAYLNELTQNARQRHEQLPLPLKTGIFIESLHILGSTKVDITGTLWQIYGEEHQNLAREINFPEATSMRLSNPYKHKNKENTTVGANINATIAQQFDFSKFPLDSQVIKIVIDHKDIEKNVVLIPDFAGYDSIRPTDLPGLDPKFKYYGFTIQRSFFSFEKLQQNSNFGVKDYQHISEHIKLAFNILITRDLMNAAIVFFIPLLVILISLFAIFSITGRIEPKSIFGFLMEKKTFVSIASYTGLLFALVALNVALRSQYPSGSILYLEYFFFYTYLTILILIVHGAFVQMESYEELIDETITPIMKNLFWPIQLGVWFITTVIVFYS